MKTQAQAFFTNYPNRIKSQRVPIFTRRLWSDTKNEHPIASPNGKRQLQVPVGLVKSILASILGNNAEHARIARIASVGDGDDDLAAAIRASLEDIPERPKEVGTPVQKRAASPVHLTVGEDNDLVEKPPKDKDTSKKQKRDVRAPAVCSGSPPPAPAEHAISEAPTATQSQCACRHGPCTMHKVFAKSQARTSNKQQTAITRKQLSELNPFQWLCIRGEDTTPPCLSQATTWLPHGGFFARNVGIKVD